jgi:hypothetical protein
MAPGRVEHAVDDAGALMVVRLGGTTLVHGPPESVAAARTHGDPALADLDLLDGLAPRDRERWPLGSALLAYADEPVDPPGLDDADLGDEPGLLARLREACPPGEVEESGLLEMEHRFVLVEDDVPVAGSAYSPWSGLLAHVGVLTVPDGRRRGRGVLVGAAATNDALACGLVPQWRVRADNAPSVALGRRLGFVALGTQTTVRLGQAS